MAFNRQLSGFPTSPLAYTGSGPNMGLSNRVPGQNDINYPLGFWWIVPVKPTGAASTDPSQEVWVLMSVAQGSAVWKRLRGGGSGPTVMGPINKIYFSTPGTFTYTPTSGMTQCYVECVGGGGASGSLNSTGWNSGNVGTTTFGFGGGGGAYSAKLFTATTIGSSQSLTIGAGGVSPTGVISNGWNSGGDGGDTLFGSFITAGGGSGSSGLTTSSPSVVGLYGAPGVATGGDININGEYGTVANNVSIAVDNTFLQTSTGKGGNSGMNMGTGGASLWYGLAGSGVTIDFSSSGNIGSGYGAGAGGANFFGSNFMLGDNAYGANGTNGLVIITEYLE